MLGLCPLREIDLLLQLRLAIIGGSEHRGAVTFIKAEQNQSEGAEAQGQFGGRGSERLGLFW